MLKLKHRYLHRHTCTCICTNITLVYLKEEQLQCKLQSEGKEGNPCSLCKRDTKQQNDRLLTAPGFG